MTKTFASYWRFLLAGLIKHAQTGALLPSQRFLVDKMIAPVPGDYSEQIVELGAGTGALTLRLARQCPNAPILACEINPVLARDLTMKLQTERLSDQVRVLADPAEHLLARLAANHKTRPDFILSGIPLGNLDKTHVLDLIKGINRALAPGGMFIQFQHSLLDRKKIKAQFTKLRTVPVFLNLPPAVIYYAQK